MHRVADTGEIEHAAGLLRAGRLVAFPTETVYGLGANALDPEAVSRIYAVKGRPATSPLIVHVASIEMAKTLVADWPAIADQLAERFWPGPLTIVLPITRAETQAPPSRRIPVRIIPPIVTAGLPSVGLRMPAHLTALALIEAAAIPLAAPSANRFTELSPTTAEHVRENLGQDVDYILDGGPCTVGIESTVLSLIEPQPMLLRPGAISRRELEALIGPLASLKDASARDTNAAAHPSPGMHPRHYSPRTPLHLVNNGEMPYQGRGVYLQYAHTPYGRNFVIHQMPQSAPDYAAALYDVLHRADAENYDWIAVDAPPDAVEWEAIRDRLQRAATKA